MDYFLQNPNRNIEDKEIVPVVTKQWEDITKSPFAAILDLISNFIAVNKIVL